MKNPSLEDLFHDTLKDIYYAEKRMLKALPKMAKSAKSPELKEAYDTHRGQTQVHVERLEQVFGLIGQKPETKVCTAIDGILKEGDDVMETFKGKPALDAGLISSSQAVEHYEIARYGTLRTWARTLGLADVEALLQATLDEEEETDGLLTELAEGDINEAALRAA